MHPSLWEQLLAPYCWVVHRRLMIYENSLLYNTNHVVGTSKNLHFSSTWTKSYTILHHLDQSNLVLTLSMLVNIEIHTKWWLVGNRLCSGTQSQSWKDPSPVLFLKTVQGNSGVQWTLQLPALKERELHLGPFVCPHSTFVFFSTTVVGLRQNFHHRCDYSCRIF